MNPETFLANRGLITGPGVIQIDIAAVSKSVDEFNVTDRALCDHNCELEGGYECPARIFAPQNRGLRRRDVAPATKLFSAITTATQGLSQYNHHMLTTDHFDRYCEQFNIPPAINAGMRHHLSNHNFMINLFGGNAEMHPQALHLAQRCRESGWNTTLTTTGGVLLRDNLESQDFLARLRNHPVNVLAITAEFTSAQQVTHLAGLSTHALRDTWRNIPPRLGQLRKGIETINVIRLQNESPHDFPQVLLNMVVHRELLKDRGQRVEETIDALHHVAPHVRVNPYPAQSFRHQDTDPLSFETTDLPALEQFLTHRRQEQAQAHPQMALRPHYYAMLQAVIDTYRQQPDQAIAGLSGEQTWKCFSQAHGLSGAGRVVQIGASPYPRNPGQFPHAGGFLSCFWDDRTITNPTQQVWNLTPTDIARHIDTDISRRASQIDNPCRGCIMPRLTGDQPELELGMDPHLKTAYLQIRQQDIGY